MKSFLHKALACAIVCTVLISASCLALFKPATCAVLIAAWALYSVLPALKLWLVSSAAYRPSASIQ